MQYVAVNVKIVPYKTVQIVQMGMVHLLVVYANAIAEGETNCIE